MSATTLFDFSLVATAFLPRLTSQLRYQWAMPAKKTAATKKTALPRLKKKHPTKREYLGLVKVAIASIDDVLADEGADPAVFYTQLAQLIDWELHETGSRLALHGHPLDPVWQDALARIHEAVFGFRCERGHGQQVPASQILPELAAADLEAAIDLVGELAEYSDGATLGQLASDGHALVAAEGLPLSATQTARLVAWLEGGPIPPS